MKKLFLKLFKWACSRNCKVVADCDGSCKNGICSKLLILFVFLSFTAFAQQGTKGEWTDKKPVTIETLTKGCTVYDTLSNGDKVYLKKDVKGRDYYFKIVPNKKGVLSRKQVYLQ